MSKKIRILLIEDDLEKQIEFKHYLKFHPNYEICGETASEYEGLLLLEKDDIEVVILDLELAAGDGLSLAKRMRTMQIRQPFVIVTTNTCSTSVFQYLRNEIHCCR